MKINFDQVIMGYKDKPIMVDEKTEAKLGFMCQVALDTQYKDEGELSASKKLERGRLIDKCVGEVDLEIEEIALLKNVTGRAYGPYLVKQIWGILDPRG